MRVEVKSIEANDILAWGQSRRDECQWFTVTVGAVGATAGDLFEVCVATTCGLSERRSREKFVGLVVPSFDAVTIENTIREFVASVEGATWEVIASELGKRMRWEYDGYRE